MAEKTYTVQKPAGRFTVGQELTDEELKADPFHEKYLRNESVTKTDQKQKAANAEAQQKRATELRSRIGELQAELDALEGTPVDANAPANVTYDVDAENPPTQKEADAARSEGKQVVQPGPGDPVVGEVKPGEAADKGKK